jgi:two-component system, OmpR family, response regulator
MRLLLVEDDAKLASAVCRGLRGGGYAVDHAADGETALADAHVWDYDAVVLDLMLPRRDGFEVCRTLRERGDGVPILVLTARGNVDDRIRGLDAGADDYVAKPFHMEELLARIRAQVRRASGHAKSDLECGPLRLDTKTARVTLRGQPIKLTSHEYRLLAYLMHHNERVVSRTELVEHLYEQDFDRDSNTIEVFIGRLRKKIPPEMIKTIRGLGYRLSQEGDDN